MTAHDPFEFILSRAEGVKRLGADRATCRSPNRRDRNPSVSVSRAANGSVLVHDFGGDTPAQLLAGWGMTLADLYPQRDLRDMTSGERAALRQAAKHAGWAAALGVLAREAYIVVAIGSMLLQGTAPTPDDLTRLSTAIERIEGARGVLA